MSITVSELRKGEVLQSLAVALQHPAVAADQQIICKLLQVCKAWKSVVQQSAAGLTNVTFDKCILIDKINLVSSFARWLAKHAGVPHTINFCYRAHPVRDDYCVQAAQHLLEFALEAAANSARGIGPPLRLQSYISSIPPTAGLIAALPAATMTSLDLSIDGSSWSSALSKLTSLRELRLSMKHMNVYLRPAQQTEKANTCMREIGRLRQLTQLIIEDVPIKTDMQLLPAQLQQLDLEFRKSCGSGEAYVWKPVVLQQVTGLQNLKLVGGELAAESSVPSTLQSLHLDARWGSGVWKGLCSLQHVTSITLCTSFVTGAHLIVLKQLPQLKDLSLSLMCISNLGPDVQEVCVAWHNLPLRNLSIATDELSLSTLQLLLQNVSVVTQLSRLVIDVDKVSVEEGVIQQPNQFVLCERLSHMTGLRCLGLHVSSPDLFDKRDAQHLSALVQLTSLDLALEASGPYLDAATVCLLAVTLTSLEALAINRRQDLDEVDGTYPTCINVSVLPAIGRLTALSSIQFGPLPSDVAEQGLEFLTGLSRLVDLHGFEAARDEARQNFWTIISPQTSRLS